MVFPTVSAADTQSGSQTSNSTSWTGTYPTNLASGDLILLFAAADGLGAVNSLPAGWVGESLGAAASNAATLSAGKKKSDGTETGSFTIGLSASEQGVWRCMRIPAATWEGTLGTFFNSVTASDEGAVSGAAGAGASGTSTAPNPGSGNPDNWDVEDTLWIALHASDHGDTTTTGFPTNYTQQDHTTAGGHSQESGGAGGAGMGIAFRQLRAASEDPGAFTTDASEQWFADLIAVRGTSATPVPRHPAINHQNPGLLMEAGRDAWRRLRSGIVVPKLWTPEEVTI